MRVVTVVSGVGELEHLLRLVADGDLAAFRAVYGLAAGRLLAIASHILRDSQAAEDAVQEAFLRVWRNADTYEASRGSPLAWMSVIARNAALDLARVRRPLVELDDGMLAALVSAPVEPPDARLGQCLDRLPPDQARSIVAMYTYGLSHAELAERLAVPLGTAKSWIRRGIRSLKECMGS